MDRKQADEQLIVQAREQLIGWLMQLRPPLYCRLKIDGSYFFPDEKKVIMKVCNALTLELKLNTALTLVTSSTALVMREQLKVQVRDQIIVQVRDQIIGWLMQLRPPLHSRLKIGDDILTGREKNVIIEVRDRLHTRLDEETLSEMVESSADLVMNLTKQIGMFAKGSYTVASKDDLGFPIHYPVWLLKSTEKIEMKIWNMIMDTDLISEKVEEQCFVEIRYMFQYYVKKLNDAVVYETSSVALEKKERERIEDSLPPSSGSESTQSYMDHLEELHTAALADREDIIAARAALAAQKHEDEQRVKRMIKRYSKTTNFCDLRLKMRM